MKRKIRLLALALCLLALFAAHGSLLWRFGKQPPRLEILQIEELPQQAQRQLAPYGLMQQEEAENGQIFDSLALSDAGILQLQQ